ncbi:MAG: DUF3786 domain-containing protein [Candidatus Helarchaeota archaeon]
MSEAQFNSANYITLRQFQGGWIWLKNINNTSSRIIPILQQLSSTQVEQIAELLKGESLPWQIFDDTQWVIRLIPLPDFIILIVFNSDEEFGSALKIFYHRSSLAIPTEDTYVFTEIFLEFLAKLAKDRLLKGDTHESGEELISLPDLLERIDPSTKQKMWNDFVGQRERPLLLIDKETAEQISKSLEIAFFAGDWRDDQVLWGLKFEILDNLHLFISLPKDKKKIQIYYSRNVLNFDSRRILFFVYLYCNAIIREARKILGDALPKLSEYL